MAVTLFEEIEARGEARGKVETVLTVPRSTFHWIPTRIENAVRQMSDPIALDSLAASIISCEMLNAFAEALK